MSGFKIYIEERLSNNSKTLFVIFFLIILYIINRHYIRPYIFDNNNNEIVIFMFGIFPNFLGTIIFCLFTRHILKFKISHIAKYIIIYSIFHESINYFLDNIKFDYFDILSTITAVLIFCCNRKI